jgi:uncharacterized membrane protein YozB (DUF420 family)
MTASTVAASGFLTARSSLGADLTLLVSAAAVVLLTAGVVLARRRRYDAHRWTQSVAVLLNTVMVVIWMLRSLVQYILPGIPASLSEHGHALAAVHAATGAVGVALGLFLVVRANQLTRRHESVSRYKPAMRAAYLVYLAGFALGVALYVVTYG